jgi:acyl carrier protein
MLNLPVSVRPTEVKIRIIPPNRQMSHGWTKPFSSVIMSSAVKQTSESTMDPFEIKNTLRGHFQATSGFIPEDGDNLFEKGALDSFGVVEFLNFLESRFGAQIQIEDITEANFSTLEAVAALILKQGAGAG